MKYTSFFLFALFCFSGNIHAQVSSGKYKLEANTTVNIVLPDTTSSVSRTYMSVYRKYWTFSKFNFITPDEKISLAKPGNLFFGFSTFKRKDYNQQSRRIELIYMQVFLKLYEYEKVEAKKGEPEIQESSIISFKMPLSNRDFYDELIDATFQYGPTYKLDSTQYDAYGSMFMWGPGLLKNYIQKVGLQLASKKAPENTSNRDLTPIDDVNAIKKLKDMTLYVPEYCLYDYKKAGKNIVRELKDEKDFFEKYTYPYEVLSEDVLNKKILESTTEFYYLVYVNDSPRKYVNVVSSTTGKVIYAEFSTPSYEFKSGDLKDLMKAIGKE